MDINGLESSGKMHFNESITDRKSTVEVENVNKCFMKGKQTIIYSFNNIDEN